VSEVERYSPQQRAEWDDFVRASRNGTFLFERAYMDYHADRFEDFSLIVRDSKKRAIALLPANRSGHSLVSHGGLTYGGFVVGSRTGAAHALEAFEHSRQFLLESGISEWLYKPVPYIYHREPADEDLYALHRNGARLVRRDVGACGRPADLKFSSATRWWITKAKKAGTTVEESDRFGDFWEVLEANLAERHGIRPVHSLGEILLLHGRFPSQIRLFLARREGAVVAGVVIYETSRVAHVQYSAATKDGMELGAPCLIVGELLKNWFVGKPWFDYGISTEDEGRSLNPGLQHFKEGFGLRATVSDWYSVPLVGGGAS